MYVFDYPEGRTPKRELVLTTSGTDLRVTYAMTREAHRTKNQTDDFIHSALTKNLKETKVGDLMKLADGL